MTRKSKVNKTNKTVYEISSFVSKVEGRYNISNSDNDL